MDAATLVRSRLQVKPGHRMVTSWWSLRRNAAAGTLVEYDATQKDLHPSRPPHRGYVTGCFG